MMKFNNENTHCPGTGKICNFLNIPLHGVTGLGKQLDIFPRKTCQEVWS
jgi:hypothetical protein